MAEFDDYYLIVLILSIISAAIIILVIGFYYFNIRAKAQIEKSYTDTFKIQSDKLAIEKRREENILAKELKEDNKRLALDVKGTMVQHVTTVVNTIKSDLELHKTILLSELSMLRNSQTQLEKDMVNNINNQKDVNDRLQKSLDMINQFTWGIDAKSIPPYVSGEVETQEHKDKLPEGLFSSPDSSETQKSKDKKKT